MSENRPPTAPSVFMSDYPLPAPGSQVAQTIPGSAGGVIEAIKKAVVSALRESISNTSLSFPTSGTQVHIELEYPITEEQYPGIWVQFATTRLQRMGMAQEFWIKDANNDWTSVQEWQVQGRVTLTVLALSNLERDRISDSLINMFAFSRTPEQVVTKPNNTNQYRQFITALDANPYVAMTVNTDIITGGGQSVNVGVPWQPDVLAYTDAYSFDIIGNFNYVFNNDGVYTLAQINNYVTMDTESYPSLNPTVGVGVSQTEAATTSNAYDTVFVPGDGAVWFYGEGLPTSDNTEGSRKDDLYLDLTSGKIYRLGG